MRACCSAAAVVVLVMLVGCGSGKVTKTPPATPELAVAEVCKDLSENKPEVLWQSLPASYQTDVNDVIRSFASTCDPELYNASFGLVQKLVKVLQSKKDLILTSPMLTAFGVKTQQLAQNWDAVINVVAPLANSELSDLNKLKALDVEKFLAATGSQCLKSLQELSALTAQDKNQKSMKATLLGFKATQVKTEGDVVTLKLEAPGEAPREERFKKVEGRWIPKDMADNWKEKIAEAKAELEKAMGKDKVQNKALALSQIKTVEGVLDQMLAAKTADEFNASVGAAFGAMMGMAKPMKQNMQSPLGQ